MPDLMRDLKARIKEIHGGRDSHSLEDLARVISLTLQTFDRAVVESALKPYSDSADDALEWIRSMRDDVQQFRTDVRAYSQEQHPFVNNYTHSVGKFVNEISNHRFKFYIAEAEIQHALEMIGKGVTEIGARTYLFEHMKTAVSEHIQLEVLPNELFDGERVYLGQGRLIMPTTVQTSGFHAFSFSYGKHNNSGKEHLHFEPLTRYGLSSLDEAIEKHVPKNMIGTVAIATNTEFYPLRETALPLIAKKYESGLRR